MPVWLVTGGSGFIGRQVLASLLSRTEIDAIAIGRRCPKGWSTKAFVSADLEQPDEVVGALTQVRPDVVIHSAGQTPPADSVSFYRANTLATVHLLDSLRALGRACRVVLAGSAAELGTVEAEDLPVTEDYPCRPIDAYGLSKWLATCTGLSARPPLETVMARVFNPIGPGQPVTQAFGRFAARLLEDKPEPLVVSTLDSRRDYIDVRDVALALIALAERGQPGLIYNVGTGRSQQVGDGLARLIERHGRPVEVRVDERFAAGGPSDSRAQIARIVSHTGWEPTIAFAQSLDDLWDEAVGRSRPGSALPLTG
jgi:GDP-4-dehydro-6-deoxy-D-mannose reductase